ncbi:MAG: EI24 domain-containing protein [Deltaproteobacteria bacterium]|nr:EI24 domain-containing protein [Deltaproteobacteria bacterium]
MQKTTVKLGEWIEAGFNLYKNNFTTLVLAALIALVLSMVSIGILAGPMIAGLIIITLQFLRKTEPKPEAGEVFKGFSYFLPSFLFTVIWGIAIMIGSLVLGWFPIIGQLLSLFFIYVAQAFLMFGLYLIVDRQMGFWPASQESIQTVKANFWPFFGLAAIASIIGSIGALAFGIGIVLTFPIQICILAVAYQEIYNTTAPSSTPDFTSEESF